MESFRFLQAWGCWGLGHWVWLAEKLLTEEGQLVTPALPCHRELVGAKWKDGQDHLTTSPFSN